ncbi:DNA internalization-related competence protein ComEC/Rec2 [Limnohabitans sp. T6-20]|uniref:DNA internalization-related competence protein ComEC/Rec2 n=1 Tax=Limnohabitans sp. T6-20 TaxID=1100725 RepID=UPI000D350424|nr:DNA internalization-related competence protein ComEC/Rec2 [Limnohabitans sp. T6-20]PUE08295.1 DNA internalization-related competence protein ComEC/Rec2 [Limnohabitans sp. T6-20]
MLSMKWGQSLGLVLLAWCAGVALQLQQQALWSAWAYAAVLCLSWGAGFTLRRVPKSVGWRAIGLCLVWGAASFAVTGLHALSRLHSIDPALEGQDLDVVGVVQAMPQRQDIGWRFRFEIEQAWRIDKTGRAQALDLPTSLPSQVYLGWYGQEGTDDSGWSTSALPEPVKAGERWRLRVRLKAPHGNLNPRGFDYELWLWEQGIRATGYVRTGAKDPAPARLAATWAHPVEGWRQAVRDRLLTHLSSTIWPWTGAAQSAQLAGVVAALVTGDQAAIDRADWDVFRATGVAHLMSISGLHVTMFAWLASALVAWCWRKSALWGFAGALRWPAAHVGALAGLGLAGFYALFSGWGVPAQRTLWMLGVVALLKMSSRQWHGPLIWLLAGAVVLTLDPWALLQPGFWLSFVAVGVLMASGQHSAQDRTPPAGLVERDAEPLRTDLVPKTIKHRWGALEFPIWGVALLRGAWGLLREQAAITWALAPLTLLFFGQVSLVGLLANLLAIPWVTLVVTPLAMLGVVWPGALVLATWALQPLVTLLAGLAAWPLASVSTATPPWALAMLALAGAVGLVLKLPLSWKLLCLPLLWPVLFWVHPRPSGAAFELLAADVGQGNAVLVRTATHSLLYDTGPRYSTESDAGHRVLVPLLAQMGERLDVLMLSHRDSDHTGGAAAVLAMQAQAHLWSSLEDEHPLHALRPGWTRCQTGQSWVWDGVLFEVLHPPATRAVQPGDSASKQPKPNEVSCVLRISSGQASALLTGDIETAQELALVQAGVAPVDVLLVPHHGSKTSSSLSFLQTLHPRLALVQAGYRNRYGHPAPPVADRYRAEGIALVESTRCGAATWRSDAPAQVQCERVLARRYWHHLVGP